MKENPQKQKINGNRRLLDKDKFGSPCKTVRVNNFNKLHIIASDSTWRKSGICKARQGGISKPASLCRDYPISRIPNSRQASTALYKAVSHSRYNGRWSSERQ